MYTIRVKHLIVKLPRNIRWCLDFPKDNDKLSINATSPTEMLLQGWVVSLSGENIFPYIKSKNESKNLHLNSNRKDVIEKILKQESKKHPQLKCGFKADININSSDYRLGFIYGGQEFDVAQVEINTSLKVLKGKDNWLFLDNDTNRSVDQYSGKFLLNSKQLEEWKSYLLRLNDLKVKYSCQATLLIAPAKEAVVPEFYPIEKGSKTPIEQILKLDESIETILYPLAALKNSEQRSFRITDTHWSHHGAKETTIALSHRFDLDLNTIVNIFSTDKYRPKNCIGDLGNKIIPPIAAEEWLIKNVNYRRSVIYDNKLSNNGRVIIIHNNKAIYNKYCLIFGSSSTYSMFNYLFRIFQNIIFIHSAGNIDEAALKAVEPDYMVAQTNGRFVIQPPSSQYNLSNQICEKLSLSEREESTNLTRHVDITLNTKLIRIIDFFNSLI